MYMLRIVTYVPNQDERAECYEGGVEVREGNRWSSRKHRLYKSRYWQVVSITIAPATVLYANSNDLCTNMRFAFARISDVARVKLARVFILHSVFPSIDGILRESLSNWRRLTLSKKYQQEENV